MTPPKIKRIHQFPDLPGFAQLAGAYLEIEVPQPGGLYKNFRGTVEQLAAYLRNQGLLGSETAALVTADATTSALTYEAPKNLTQAELNGLSLAITTAAGTNITQPTTAHLSINSLGTGTTYDSQTGWLYLVLPAGIDPADVLSVHLCRVAASGAEQVLAANLYPFGGGAGYTDAQARAAQLGRVPAQPTTTLLLTAEAPNDYGPAASGTFTVDATGCQVGKVVCFSIGVGGSAPSFTNAPTGQPYKFVPGNIYAAGTAFSYSLLVRVDRIEVVMFAD